MLDPDAAFSNLPSGLRTELVDCYRSIARNFAEARWEPAELNGGKFCEIVYCIAKGALSGAFPDRASKPTNMVQACKDLESFPPTPGLVGNRSLRIQIPRLLPYLYEIRNNRGVGHVGGDVDPSYEDASIVLASSSWVMAELVRIFHGLTLKDAQGVVDSLVSKRHPLVWRVDDIRRVLAPELKTSNQVLILLYSENGWTDIEKLRSWVEYSNRTRFRSGIIEPLHKLRYVEYSKERGAVQLTPKGVQEVETCLVKGEA